MCPHLLVWNVKVVVMQVTQTQVATKVHRESVQHCAMSPYVLWLQLITFEYCVIKMVIFAKFRFTYPLTYVPSLSVTSKVKVSMQSIAI